MHNPHIPEFDEPGPLLNSVFKYLIPDRIDVLENNAIRFTPLVSTNDVFEIRKTFKTFAGPKFLAALNHEIGTQKIDDAIRVKLIERGVSVSMASELSNDPKVSAYIRNHMQGIISDFSIPYANSDSAFEEIIVDFAGSIVALSLTEDAKSPVMWAHYAANSSGFVIEFDADNRFFRAGSDGRARMLQKISYFDGELGEIIDDPRKALMSKTTGWSYEKEWRLYAKPEEADIVFQVGDEDICLFRFPAESIKSVMLGHRIGSSVEDAITVIVKRKYPHCKFAKLHPDRSKSNFSVEEIF